MSKAPKQYILPNGSSIGDKDSIAINGINSIAGNNGTTIFKNGVKVTDSITAPNGLSYRQYTHIDSTEYLVVSFFQADGNTYLDKFNLNTGLTTGRIILAPNGIGSQDIVDNKSLLTYLGRINGNRYAFVSAYNLNTTFPNFWDAGLLNLETMTFETGSVGQTGGLSVPITDFTFDGVDKVYCVLSEVSLAVYDINTGQVTQVLDSDNNPISAKRIYGLTDTRLAIQLPDSSRLRVWNRSFQAGSFNSREYASNALPIPKQVNQTLYWLSSDNIGNVYLKGETGETNFDLTQSLIDAAVIGPGEINLIPVCITNYTEDNGVIEINWVLFRATSGTKSLETLKTTINNGVVSTQRFTNNTLDGSITVQFMITNTNNTTNGYYLNRQGVAKFYNKALQDKWNNR